MSKVVVSDTGPLIVMGLIGLLPILPKLFSTVYAPEAVISEATQDASKPGAQAILDALTKGIICCKPVDMPDNYRVLADLLDQGEAEAIALAEQLGAVALIDERRGRAVAKKHGVSISGTPAVLIKAKRALLT